MGAAGTEGRIARVPGAAVRRACAACEGHGGRARTRAAVIRRGGGTGADAGIPGSLTGGTVRYRRPTVRDWPGSPGGPRHSNRAKAGTTSSPSSSRLRPVGNRGRRDLRIVVVYRRASSSPTMARGRDSAAPQSLLFLDARTGNTGCGGAACSPRRGASSLPQEPSGSCDNGEQAVHDFEKGE